MDRFLTSNKTEYRLLRTIVQGILGVIVANLDYIVGLGHFAPGTKALIVALVMAVLSPIMSELGKHLGVVDEEDPDDEIDEDPEDIESPADNEEASEGGDE